MSALDFSRPLIMGILNLTPDSFSDGGRFQDLETAVNHGLRMAEEGANVIDVGGESTRPDSTRVSATEQKKRTLEVISNLRQVIPKDVLISIDTTLAEVATEGLQAGATIINDISAGREDPDIVKLAAKTHCPYIIMHMQGTPETMQDEPSYDDVVKEVKQFLLSQAEIAQSIGVKAENIIIDPGIGFGKTKQNNLELMRHLDQFVNTGYPVLLGASRKRFMGSICANTEPSELIGATCATTVMGINADVKLFRVHDVKANRQAADVAWAVKSVISNS